MRKFALAILLLAFCLPLIQADEADNKNRMAAGTIEKISDDALAVKVGEKTLTFSLAGAEYRNEKDGEIKQSDLKNGNTVIVQYTPAGREGGKALNIHRAKAIKGKVNKASRSSLTLNDSDNKAWTLSMPTNTLVAQHNDLAAARLAADQQCTAFVYQKGDEIICPVVLVHKD